MWEFIIPIIIYVWGLLTVYMMRHEELKDWVHWLVLIFWPVIPILHTYYLIQEKRRRQIVIIFFMFLYF